MTQGRRDEADVLAEWANRSVTAGVATTRYAIAAPRGLTAQAGVQVASPCDGTPSRVQSGMRCCAVTIRSPWRSWTTGRMTCWPSRLLPTWTPRASAAVRTTTQWRPWRPSRTAAAVRAHPWSLDRCPPRQRSGTSLRPTTG